MGSGGGGDGGGREPGRNEAYLNKQKKKKKPTATKPATSSNNDKPSDNRPSVPTPPKPKPAINEAVEARIGPSKNLTKSFEETKKARKGQDTGDLPARVDVFKTPADFSAGVDRAKNRGPSPGDVMATFGSVGDLNRDTVAANVAGRPGLNVANMGQLATRARVGQLPDKNVNLPGPMKSMMPGGMYINVLNTVGRKSASNLLTTIANDRPTMKDGKVTYGTSLVADKDTGTATSYGNIQGYVKDGRYTGRGDYSPDLTPSGPVTEARPVLGGGGNDEPALKPVTKPKKEVPTSEPKDASQRRLALLTGGAGSAAQRLLLGKKRRR